MICSTSRKLEFAVWAAKIEVDLRHAARKGYLEESDSQWDDDRMAFVEQAVAEAEIRSTEARLALDMHRTACIFCATGNAN